MEFFKCFDPNIRWCSTEINAYESFAGVCRGKNDCVKFFGKDIREVLLHFSNKLVIPFIAYKYSSKKLGIFYNKVVTNSIS